ncbi:ribonuclease D [Endozoicomonas sp. Mp262]|uniref:ribonuclease D n=1 Tax=Endozoicomonas sp. Mp262 TaxID=2919499 RepID=UPI0021DA50D2
MLQESPSPIWISDNTDLAKYCQHWSQLGKIALDTEFIRTDTYYPIPGLIQIGIENNEIFLVDPLTIDQWQPLKELLENPAILKVIHACSEDLEVIELLTGARLNPIFDTQLAAAYAGIGYSLGYQKLVKQLLGIELPKDETRSNWCQRPLTEAQQHYATLDVLHLLTIHSILNKELEKNTTKAWLEDDCNQMKSSIYSNNAEDAWKEVKCAWQLYPQQLAVLKSLCIYRENKARQRNLPRNRVIPKGSLWPMARYQPDNLKSLSAIQDMRKSIIKRDGQRLLTLIKTASQSPREYHPRPLPRPLPKKTRIYGKAIKEFLNTMANQLNLPVEILLPSKTTSPILRNWLETGQFALPEALQGWRREVIGIPLIKKLNTLIETP